MIPGLMPLVNMRLLPSCVHFLQPTACPKWEFISFGSVVPKLKRLSSSSEIPCERAIEMRVSWWRLYTDGLRAGQRGASALEGDAVADGYCSLGSPPEGPIGLTAHVV
jgi:hypothetical protein